MLEMAVKEELRREMAKTRKAMSPDDVKEKSEKIVAMLQQIPEYAAAMTIMAYVPKGNEVNINAAIAKMLAEGKTVIIPAASGQTLLPVQINDYPRDIEKGPLGMGEPKNKTEYRGKIDVAVIPGLAFNEQGYRLGRGGGHYDRMLEGMQLFKIGVAYDWQIRSFQAEKHDQPMDIIVTESNVIRCGI